MDTATASVLVSGAVGLAGISSPFALRILDSKRDDEARRDARLDELRSVLDAACAGLVLASERVPKQHDNPATPQAFRDAANHLNEAVHAVYREDARLAARLGPDHEVVPAYDAIFAALRDMVRLLFAQAANEPAPVLGGADLQQEFQTSQNRFLLASAQLIGLDRPAGKP